MKGTAIRFGLVLLLRTGGTPNRLVSKGRFQITDGPRHGPPKEIRFRFRHPQQKPLARVTVNGRPWRTFSGKWGTTPSMES
jgi:hypothetical protein